MSVATEITRLQTAKANLKASIEAKGVTVSSSALIDTYASLVDSIPSGGGASVEEKLVNFIDYDGTIVASYTGVEVQALTALPSAPNHSSDEVPLTFDEWNWTLSEIKTYNTNCPDGMIVVGANYHTTDNKAHFFFNITSTKDGNGVEFALSRSVGDTVDWGDGSAVETISSNTVTHLYTSIGIFHCVVNSSSNTYEFGGSSSTRRGTREKLIRAFFPSTATTFSSTSCFRSCKSLQNVSFSKNAAMSGTIFRECAALRSIVIPRATTTIETYLCGSNFALQSVALPGNLTSIVDYGFASCSALNLITIPSGVTNIGGSAFTNVDSLQSVVIPSDVTTIGGYAFSNCFNLYSVIVLPTTPPTLSNSNAFSTSQKKIYVPYSSDHSVLAAYQSASNWSTYASIMEELPQ